MFKKKALQVKVVNADDRNIETECHHLDPELLNTIIKEQVKHAAIVAVAVFTVSTILGTVSQILINKSAQSKEK